MAGNRNRRAGNKAATKRQLSLGDLVLAKVKGFPAWPAKVSRPEDWDRDPNPKKIFVYFFGTEEIGFMAPANVQVFTNETKAKLVARCEGKNKLLKGFAQAVKEICAAFDEHPSNQASTVRDDMDELQKSADGLENDGVEVYEKVIKDTAGIIQETADEESGQLSSELDRCLRGHFGDDNQDIKPSMPFHYCRRSLIAPSEKNKKPNRIREKKVSAQDGSSCLRSRTSGIKDHGITKQSGIGQKSLSSGKQCKSDADSSKGGRSGGNLNNLGHGEKSRDQIKGPSSQKEQVQNIKETDDGLEDMGISEEQVCGEPFGPKVSVVLGLGKPSTDVSLHPKMSVHVENNVYTRSSFQKAVKKNDALSSNISAYEAIKQLDDDKPTATVRGLLGSEVKAGMTDNSGEETSLPLAKRRRGSMEALSDSVTSFDDRWEKFPRGPKNDITRISTLPKKRRAVFLYEDDEDEQPTTPVHGRLPKNLKVSVNVPDDQKITEPLDSSASKDVAPAEPSQPQEEALSLPSLRAFKKESDRGALACVGISSNGSEVEQMSLNRVKDSMVSPNRPILVNRPIPEPHKFNVPQIKSSSNGKQKNASCGSRNELKPFQSRVASQGIMQQSSLERLKRTQRTVSGAYASSLVEHAVDSNHSRSERMDIAVEDNGTLLSTSSTLDSTLSMKRLIAAAQAKRRKTHAKNFSIGTSSFSAGLSTGPQRMSPSSTTSPAELQRSNGQINLTPPSAQADLTRSQDQHNAEGLAERRANSGSRHAGESLSGETEAAVARDAFQGMIETLSRTKDSIKRATRHAIDCAKFGIANEVVEILIRKLEYESSSHRKVDLFFLVDSITQCSHSQKGIARASYIPVVQSALLRLLGAAAPMGVGYRENRHQCLKILRLWLERKIFPESVLRHYIDDIGVPNDDATTKSFLRRPSRAERAVDDPIREMEGMFVDEYGSNAAFQLPGFLPSHVFEDDEKEDDPDLPIILAEGGCLATLPEESVHVSGNASSPDATSSGMCYCVLQEVNGKFEMEGVSGRPKDERSLAIHNTESVSQPQETDEILEHASADSSELTPLPDGSPPLPLDSPPPPPPLPSSPPPLLPPPPPLYPHLPPPPCPSQLQPPLPPAPPSGPSPFISPTVVLPPHPLTSQPLVQPQSSFHSLHQLVYQPPVLHEYSVPYTKKPPHMIPSQIVSSQYSYRKPPIPQYDPSQHPYAHQYSYLPPDARRPFPYDNSSRVSLTEFDADKHSGSWVNGTRSSATPGGAYFQEGYFSATS